MWIDIAEGAQNMMICLQAPHPALKILPRHIRR
jgi:hypothetical protein